MILQTERLYFSTAREQDAYDVYSHRQEKESTVFTGGIIEKSWQVFEKEYLQNCINKDFIRRNVYSVILKDKNKYIGYCGFQYCKILKGIELFYGYSSKYWGNGYALEAAKALLSYGFNTLKFEDILAAVNPVNPASEAILKKIGMNFDGTIEWPKQGIVNRYCLTREQFLNDI